MSVSDSTQDPTMTVDEFLAMEAADRNAWWRLQCGDHQNLFADAVEQRDAAVAERDEAYQVLAALMEAWDALPYDWSVVVRCEDAARRLLAETGKSDG